MEMNIKFHIWFLRLQGLSRYLFIVSLGVLNKIYREHLSGKTNKLKSIENISVVKLTNLMYMP